MNKSYGPADRKASSAGKTGKATHVAAAGGADFSAAGVDMTSNVAGGKGSPDFATSHSGLQLGAAGGFAAPGAADVEADTAAIAGGNAPHDADLPAVAAGGHASSADPAASSAFALAGGDGPATADAPAGGDPSGNQDRGTPSFHILGPRDHVVTDDNIPGVGDLGDTPNYVKRGSTAHFVVYYDSTLGNAGTSAADAVLAKCEADYNTLRGWFSGTTPASLPFTIYITTANSGASHASCSATALYIGANSANPINNNFILQLLIAEADEVFEANFGHGWNCGASNGEGLSRVLANDLYPGVEPANFVSSHVWLDTPGRPDWINNTDGTDRNYISIGCSVLFLNWMRFQLGYSWQQIIAAGGSTLAQTYQNLTGQTDGYMLFMALMDRTYPRGTLSGLTTDNPFPMQDLAYTAVFRPGSGAEWVVPAQSWSAMFSTINSYFKQGLYAESLDIVADDNTMLYTAVFRPGSGAEWVVPAEPWSSMSSVISNYFRQGLYVTALGTAVSGNEVVYSAVFRPGSGAEWVVPAQPWSQFATTVSTYFKQGLYVTSLAATIQNGTVLYTAVFRPGSGAEWVVPAQPWAQFSTTVNSYFKQGLYATGIAVVESPGGPLYAAVFRPGSGAEWVVGSNIWKDMAKQVDTYFAQHLYAIGISACRLAV